MCRIETFDCGLLIRSVAHGSPLKICDADFRFQVLLDFCIVDCMQTKQGVLLQWNLSQSEDCQTGCIMIVTTIMYAKFCDVYGTDELEITCAYQWQYVLLEFNRYV